MDNIIPSWNFIWSTAQEPSKVIDWAQNIPTTEWIFQSQTFSPDFWELLSMHFVLQKSMFDSMKWETALPRSICILLTKRKFNPKVPQAFLASGYKWDHTLFIYLTPMSTNLGLQRAILSVLRPSIFATTWWGRYYLLSHFTNEETETQRGPVPSPRTQSC